MHILVFFPIDMGDAHQAPRSFVKPSVQKNHEAQP